MFASVTQATFPVIGARVVAIIESATPGGQTIEVMMRDHGSGADMTKVDQVLLLDAAN